MSRKGIPRPASLGGRAPSVNVNDRPRIGGGSTEDLREGLDTNWNVDDAALRPIPPLHPPLDPQSTAFVCDASPSVIAARVSECLRQQSIMTEFHDETATASALTSNRVRFMIRMYQGGGPAVVVELQRLRGDTITFHQASRAILSSARGNSTGQQMFHPNIPNGGMGLALDIPIRGQLPSYDNHNDDDDLTSVLLALEIDWSLIKKDRMDANILGWESLALLTDPYGSNTTTAITAARVVLGLAPRDADNDDDERFLEIHASVISLIQHGREQAPYAEGKTPDDEDEDLPHDLEHLVVQRSLAIRSLANSLEVLSQHHTNLQQAIPNLMRENIMRSLMDEVALAILPNNPFNASDATHAIRALTVLFEHEEEARNIAHRSNMRGILSKARLVGRSRHQALERAAERAFEVLGEFQRQGQAQEQTNVATMPR